MGIYTIQVLNARQIPFTVEIVDSTGKGAQWAKSEALQQGANVFGIPTSELTAVIKTADLCIVESDDF